LKKSDKTTKEEERKLGKKKAGRGNARPSSVSVGACERIEQFWVGRKKVQKAVTMKNTIKKKEKKGQRKGD